MSVGGAPRNRWRGVAVVVVVAVGIAILAARGLGGSLVYYRTPGEVMSGPPAPDRHFRLGGLVVAGSVVEVGDTVRFTLTDGVHDIRVEHRGNVPPLFRPGQGAVVEGWLDGRGVFHSDLVMVRHSNEYRPPTSAKAAS